MTLRVGQKVTLKDAVIAEDDGRGAFCRVDVDGCTFYVPRNSLTPVPDPEPQWTPGDVVSIDGVNYMLYDGGAGRRWMSCTWSNRSLTTSEVSEVWSEGRVVIVHRKEDNK